MDAFWNDPATVAQFASREPDVHLVAGLAARARPGGIVLDLGAAGGRNTEYLARAAQRVVALDAAAAMVRHVRQRCAELSPRPAAVSGSMTAMPLANACVDGVAAIGIYHQAESDLDLQAALAETRRVMRTGAWLVVSVFAVAMLPPEARRVPGQQHLYRTGDETVCRLTETELLALWQAHGLRRDGEVQTRPGAPGTNRVTLVGWFRAV